MSAENHSLALMLMAVLSVGDVPGYVLVTNSWEYQHYLYNTFTCGAERYAVKEVKRRRKNIYSHRFSRDSHKEWQQFVFVLIHTCAN